MQQKCEVAIIGAGVAGLSVATYLSRAGIAEVVVIDRHSGPGQGSTALANGGIRAQWTTRANIAFSLFSIAEYERLHAETQGLPGLVQAGYLFFTGTEAGEERLRRGYELQRACGVETEWLSPTGVLSRAPFIRPDGLRAGTFHRRDGFIDPHGVASALFAVARRHGATFLFETEVRGIQVEREGRFEITHSAGRLSSRWLVNAAGPDAAEVATHFGANLPVRPVRRNLACTEPVKGYPEVIPMCIDADTGVLIRRESGGFLIAYSNPGDPPCRDTSLDPQFLEDLAERIGNRFPFLDSVPIDPRKCWAGLYPETPDHHAIIGETPGIPRFLQAVGFGGHGIMHAPATGRAIADLVKAGRSQVLDLHPFRLSRFAEGDLVVDTAVL